MPCYVSLIPHESFSDNSLYPFWSLRSVGGRFLVAVPWARYAWQCTGEGPSPAVLLVLPPDGCYATALLQLPDVRVDVAWTE